MDDGFRRKVEERLCGILKAGGHRLAYAPGGGAIDELKDRGIELSTMGRGFDEEPEFFLTSAAAGAYARKLVH